MLNGETRMEVYVNGSSAGRCLGIERETEEAESGPCTLEAQNANSPLKTTPMNAS
jgi:hypothetical protein